MPAHVYVALYSSLSCLTDNIQLTGRPLNQVSEGTFLKTASTSIHSGRPPQLIVVLYDHVLQATADWTSERQLTQMGQSNSFPRNSNQVCGTIHSERKRV